MCFQCVLPSKLRSHYKVITDSSEISVNVNVYWVMRTWSIYTVVGF